MEPLNEVIHEEGISLAIITVPSDLAQSVADQRVDAGVHGLLNFVPVPLQVPSHIHAEDVDITMSMEKAAQPAADHISIVPTCWRSGQCCRRSAGVTKYAS